MTAPTMTNQTEKMKMKKIVMLAAVFGFAAVLSASAADANQNWTDHCATCHGADGKGQTKMGQRLGVKDFTDARKA